MELAHIACTRYLYDLTMHVYERLAAKRTINIAIHVISRVFVGTVQFQSPLRFRPLWTSSRHTCRWFTILYYSILRLHFIRVIRPRFIEHGCTRKNLSSRLSAIILSVLARRPLILPGGQTKNCTSKVGRGHGFVLANAWRFPRASFSNPNNFEQDRMI